MYFGLIFNPIWLNLNSKAFISTNLDGQCGFILTTALAISRCQIGLEENRKWHPEKSAAKLANHDYQNGMKWKNRDIPTRAPNTSLDQLRSQVHRGDSRGGPGQKSADTIFGSNDKWHFRTTEWQFRMTTEIAISNTMIIMSNFRPQNDIKTLAHKPYGLGIRYFEHHQQHILVKFQAPKWYKDFSA